MLLAYIAERAVWLATKPVTLQPPARPSVLLASSSLSRACIYKTARILRASATNPIRLSTRRLLGLLWLLDVLRRGRGKGGKDCLCVGTFRGTYESLKMPVTHLARLEVVLHWGARWLPWPHLPHNDYLMYRMRNIRISYGYSQYI